jgi:methylenetetrahydrofolate dehydrogenase (NADP+)/methenyltetrahydrofolate cyclohydrolase
MKHLNGLELAEFIKERQAKAVRGLRQAHLVEPKLAIVVTVDNPVIEIYMRLKKRYGADILVDVEIHKVSMDETEELINRLNNDDSVHAIIVQLPLEDISKTRLILDLVLPEKDVDALGNKAIYDPATPTAILWLLAGYGVDLKNKKVVLVGRGKLVGKPLQRMLKDSGVDVESCDDGDDVSGTVSSAEIIITATGSPGVLTADMIPKGAVVVDAGIAVEKGKSVGDLSDDVYQRDDLTITPKRGGVGPLTVCALFENVIKAAKATVK